MYYFSQSGETSGPISEADLQARIADGSLPPTINVWREGMAGWLPYNQVSAAAPGQAAPPPLRVTVSPAAIAASHAAQQQPEYADTFGNGASADVQGSTRFESASSWGMVVIVGLAMFVFIGVLASRPRDLVYANGMELVDLDDGFDAEVQLKAGVLHLENLSEFPWAATTLSFRSGGSRYTYLLGGIPKEGEISIPLTDFVSTKGKFASTSPSAHPRELTIRVQGHGTVTAEIDTAP
jgi:hypothetical protein